MHYDVDYEETGALVTLSTHGDLTVGGLTDLLQDVLGDPRWMPGMRMIVDHRRASAAQLSIDDLARVSNWVVAHKDRFGAGRCAIIAPEGGWTKVSMWVFQTNDDVDLDIKIFQSLRSAREWIDEQTFTLQVSAISPTNF